MSAPIPEILKSSKIIAVVGISDKTDRPSYGVSRYMQSQGYRIIPVNPVLKVAELLGEKVYSDLASVPEKIDIVDIFRKSEDVPPVVDQAIQAGAKVIWMQEGIENSEAAAKAEKAGLKVVMNKCILKEHKSQSSQL